MIYFTFIGNHDQIEPGQPYGAALTIFLQYKAEVNRVYLFITPAKRQTAVNYEEIARKTKNSSSLGTKLLLQSPRYHPDWFRQKPSHRRLTSHSDSRAGCPVTVGCRSDLRIGAA